MSADVHHHVDVMCSQELRDILSEGVTWELRACPTDGVLDEFLRRVTHGSPFAGWHPSQAETSLDYTPGRRPSGSRRTVAVTRFLQGFRA